MDDWITTGRLMLLWGISKQRVHQLCVEGRIPYRFFGRVRCYRLSMLKEKFPERFEQGELFNRDGSEIGGRSL